MATLSVVAWALGFADKMKEGRELGFALGTTLGRELGVTLWGTKRATSLSTFSGSVTSSRAKVVITGS